MLRTKHRKSRMLSKILHSVREKVQKVDEMFGISVSDELKKGMEEEMERMDMLKLKKTKT